MEEIQLGYTQDNKNTDNLHEKVKLKKYLLSLTSEIGSKKKKRVKNELKAR